jgi:hypothetical protein
MLAWQRSSNAKTHISQVVPSWQLYLELRLHVLFE